MKLSNLQNIEDKEKFIKNVVTDVKQRLKKEMITNTGIKGKDEILELIRKGKDIKFSYDILIEDAKGF